MDESGLNYFAAPPRPVIDNSKQQLAEALGAFSSDVQRFGAQWNAQQKQNEAKQEKTDSTAAQGLIASKTPAEWQQMVKDGTLPSFASPMAQQAVERTTGQYAAHNLANDVQAKVASGELNYSDGSAQRYLDDQRKQIVQSNGWNQNSGQMRGFGDGFNTIWNNVQNKGTQAAIENMNEQHNQAAFQQIDMTVDRAFQQHLDPAATWDHLNGIRQGLVDTMHFEPKELDPIIFDALKRRAAQDPNWVMGVGNAQRTDLDGKTAIPSLFSKNTYADQVQQLSQHAQAFNAKQDDEAQKQSLTGNVADILTKAPAELSQVPDQLYYKNSVTGATGQVSKTELTKDVVNSTLMRDLQRVKSGQATPEQVQNEQLQTFAQAGIKQPQWAETLNNAAKGGVNFTTTSDPKTQGSALKAFQLYQDLRTKNPAYLDSLMDEKAKRLYDTAYMQQTIFNKSPVDALQAASELQTSGKDSEESSDLSQQRSLIDSTAAGLKWGGMFDPNIKNPEIAKGALKTAAQSLMRLNGMSATDAIQAATPYVQNAYVPVNGVLVPDMHYLPKEEMQPAAERYLTDWAAGPAKALNLDPKSLSIAPVGTGRFIVVDAASGLPISHGNGMSYVTARDLVASSKAIQQDAAHYYGKQSDDAAQGAARVIMNNRTDRAQGTQWNLDPQP